MTLDQALVEARARAVALGPDLGGLYLSAYLATLWQVLLSRYSALLDADELRRADRDADAAALVVIEEAAP